MEKHDEQQPETVIVYGQARKAELDVTASMSPRAFAEFITHLNAGKAPAIDVAQTPLPAVDEEE
ncbi:MAG: hypothetical protein ACYCOU_01070 [Sulfobacillus sp.]